MDEPKKQDPERLDAWVDRLNEGERVRSDEALSQDEAAALRWLEVLNVPGSVSGQTSDSEELVGKRLGPYLLLACIGEGGQGRVYEAVHDSLERKVALKVLPEQFGRTPKQVARFRREARAAASLKHPGIVGVYEVGESEGAYYYAMEFVDGAPLSSFIRSQKKPESSSESPLDPDVNAVGGYFRWAATVVLDCAEAMGYAHRHGVIHRDIKPSNVLVGCDARVRLSDFGLARIEADPTITRTGIRFGTLSYMSPEHVDGNHLDTRSDVFSLGVTLYELVTLNRPFPGNTEGEILYRIVNEEVERPRRVRAGIDKDLEAIILKALEKNPSLRYPNGDAMAADLRRYLAHELVEARPWSIFAGVRKWVRRNPKLALAAFFFVLSSGGALIWAEKYRRQSLVLNEVQVAKMRDQATHAVRVGVLQLAQGATAAARVQFQNALSLEPERMEAKLLLILAEIESSQTSVVRDAQVRMTKILREFPDLAGAHFLRAITLSRKGRDEQANQAVRRAESISSRLPVEVYLHAAVAQETGQYEKALELFHEAVRLAPNAVEYLYSRQCCYLDLGEDRQAFGDAWMIAHTASTDSWAHRNLGDISLVLGDPKDSIESYEKALALDPVDLPTRLHKSLTLSLSGNGKDAEAEVSDLLLGFSEDPRVWTTNALSLLRQGRFLEGRASVERAISLAPGDGYSRRVLGDCFLLGAESEKAQESYQLAFKDPISAPASSYGMALVHLRNLDSREAAKAFLRACHPVSVSVKDWISGLFWIRSPILPSLDREAILECCVETCDLLGGSNALALATLAAAYEEMGEIEKARSLVSGSRLLLDTNPFVRVAFRLQKNQLNQ